MSPNTSQRVALAPSGVGAALRRNERKPIMIRGRVEIKGVTTRTTREARTCTACKRIIPRGHNYERVARLDGAIESYGTKCFEDEFGPREAYGA
jgi:hypothetical protein